MKIAIASAALLLLTALISPVASAQHSHHHASPAPSQEAPAHRWDSDAPLRAGMAKIRAAVEGLQHYGRGHMGPEHASTLASSIQAQIGYIIANCKLDPQADAALHVIIAGLATGAQALKADPSNLAAIAPMREALASYSRQFNDATWPVDSP